MLVYNVSSKDMFLINYAQGGHEFHIKAVELKCNRDRLSFVVS